MNTNTNNVKASTLTTLELDYRNMPVRILTAGEAIAALFRLRVEFYNGQRTVFAPYAVLDNQRRHFDGETWLKQKDLFLAENYPRLRSGSGVWPVPTVLRVMSIYKAPKRKPKRKKPSLAYLCKRDDYTCAITLKRYPPDQYDPEEVFNRDHVIPRALGGEDVEENMVLTTKEANTKKGCTFPYYDAKGRELKGKPGSAGPLDYLELHRATFRKEWEPFLFQALEAAQRTN